MRMLTLIAILFFSFSCKKNKLEDGKEIFIGKWNWVYSKHEYNICQGFAQNEILTPETENRDYSMEFFEKGIVKFYENAAQTARYRLVFNDFSFGECSFIDDCYAFNCDLNNETHDLFYKIYGSINSDTIAFNRGFPFQDSEHGCEYHISYFVKE